MTNAKTATDKRTAVEPTDTELQQDVLDELAWDGHVRACEIGVAVSDGIVTLSGAVDSYLARMAAQDAAHRVRGVRAVANEIVVRLPAFAERTDEEIARAAINALTWDAAIPAHCLEISVTDGWITLRGELDTYRQREAVERVLRRLAGVKGISEMIAVTAGVAPEDLAVHVRRALIRSASVDVRDLEVHVVDTVAVLRGKVRSLHEQHEAERIALATPGVTAIESNLTVEPSPL